MKKSLTIVMLILMILVASGCEGTWKGAKEDTSKGTQWSKDKVNDGAKYIEKKTDWFETILKLETLWISLT